MDTRKCDQCGKLFRKRWDRDNHRATVHSNAPLLHQCQVIGCNMSFSFFRQLQNHNKSVHCHDYQCNKCGLSTFRDKCDWTAHCMAVCATYEEKVTHALTQEEGENYLWKIYLFVDTNGVYYKIECTSYPTNKRLNDLKSQFGYTMVCIKSWNLSAKFTKHLAEMLENELHDYMHKLGFINLEGTHEYFYFRNQDLEKKLVQYFIETLLEKYEQLEIVPVPPPVIVEQKTRAEKRKWVQQVDNLTEKQLKKQTYNKKWRQNNRGNYIYCFSNGIDVIKIGQTSLNLIDRLGKYNNKSSHGKFESIAHWLLGENYNTATQRKSVEDKIIYEIGQLFPRIAGKREHFNVLPSQYIEVIAIIDKIINSL